jgi:hypothetical protein
VAVDDWLAELSDTEAPCTDWADPRPGTASAQLLSRSACKVFLRIMYMTSSPPEEVLFAFGGPEQDDRHMKTTNKNSKLQVI